MIKSHFTVTFSEPVQPPRATSHLSSLMQLFDTDKDERITREEFTALLRSALGVSDINMAKLFKEIDADSSGFITFSK